MKRLLLAFMLALFFVSSKNGEKNNSPRVKASSQENKHTSTVIKSGNLLKNTNGSIKTK